MSAFTEKVRSLQPKQQNIRSRNVSSYQAVNGHSGSIAAAEEEEVFAVTKAAVIENPTVKVKADVVVLLIKGGII